MLLKWELRKKEPKNSYNQSGRKPRSQKLTFDCIVGIVSKLMIKIYKNVGYNHVNVGVVGLYMVHRKTILEHTGSTGDLEYGV